jgi:hypothetical protein
MMQSHKEDSGINITIVTARAVSQTKQIKQKM